MTVLSKLASSVMVKVKKKGQKRDQMPKYNIGLSIKNKAQGIHVPYHVYYDLNAKELKVSKEVEKLFTEYAELFPYVFYYLGKLEMEGAREAPEAHDMFPNFADPEEPLKKILSWIMSSPISKLPYIPEGYEIIQPQVREAINAKLNVQKDTQQELLQVTMPVRNVFVESYPFWIRPFRMSTSIDYQVGDRVLSIKTCGTGFVPFGSIGTIVGVYSQKVLVQFDKPLITGSSYYGQCEKYRGKILDSHAVLNLSM